MTALSLALSIVYLGASPTGPQDPANGIYRFALDTETGTISDLTLAAETLNPTFLAHHPIGRYLYAVNESKTFNGEAGGGVSAFAVDAATGSLTLLNQQPTGGNNPCHLSVDATGRVIIAANYSSGDVSVFPVLANGSLGPRSDFHRHSGTGPNAKRQEGPHAHGVAFSPDNRFVLINDLGIDQIVVYKLDAEQAKLIPHGSVKSAPGAGPRHFSFVPGASQGYAINELDNSITRYDWDAESGTLTPRETIPTLPADFTGFSKTAELVLHPNGGFLYGSNRGHDSIAVYRRDWTTGQLALIEIVPTGGSEPRSFAVSPDGRWLISANQYVHTLQVFRIDAETGKLTAQGEPVPAPSPICVLF